MVKATKKSKRTKICDICGDSGFMEDIVTCHCCKRAFQHIYCMQMLRFDFPDVWYCDGCLPKAHVVHEGKMKGMRTEINSFKTCSSDSKRAKSPTKESPRLNDDRTPEEIKNGRKLNGKHVTHSSSPNAFFKAIENAKVKFIPPEEVALTYAMTSCKPGNSGASCRPSDHANIMCPTNSRKALTNMSRSPSLTTTRVLGLPNEATVNVEAGLSRGKVIMAKEDVADDKEGNMQKSKVSGYDSSSKCIVSAASDNSFNASTLYTEDGMKNRTKCKALGEASAEPTEEKCMERSIVAAEIYPQLKRIQKKQTKCVDVGVQHTRDEKKVRTGDSSGGIVCSATRCKRSASKEDDLPLTLLINPNEKLLNCPAPGACWKGAFEVFDMVNHIYSEIQAHFSSQVSAKAYEILKKLPVKLKLNMLPRRDAWPKIFQLVPPTNDDIGLYFFPSQIERRREKYFRLLERINSRDFAMQAWIGDVELLIYPSKHLMMDSHRIDGQTYLWGMFRHVKHRKHSQHRQDTSSSFGPAADLKGNKYAPLTISFEGGDQEVDMEIDMEGGKEIGRVDKPIRKRDAPPGFPFRSLTSLEANAVCRPLAKFSLQKTSSTRSDDSPGFSTTSTIKQGRISPAANQIQLASETYDNPLSSPKLSQTSAATLPLFPQKSEIRKVNENDDCNTRQTISADLSLSRPQYVMNGNGWVSTSARISFDQDGCMEDLQLKL